MPTYRYRCTECGHEFEEFQQITADPLTSCPQCAKETLARVLGGGAGIIFKGSGFYLTDYKNAPAGRSTGTKDADQSKSGKGGTAGSGEEKSGKNSPQSGNADKQ